ncbi:MULTISPECIES: helix-turn-helix domain-containing protein [Dyadobacter]|uniref:AraC family transcriptional regulator n=1 Tax=Dyadobacter chenhuakuii TaxID=2909339 RepID=A0A9X1QGH1_9BACT|nr:MULTISPECIES: AraC family transcriptional regulator [Dyadobacter]MCF2501285.1 AraC family transcriptional regulator [Dyadobacter chenhuakuii]MCF2502136.1 AraC family transcriptional regulator [Dyadobacter fanqingshengii]
MDQIKRIDTVKDYNAWIGVETFHPLVSIIIFDEISAVREFRGCMGVYAIFFKNLECGDITYGCQPYDYDNGTLIFVAPGQVYDVDDNDIMTKPSGYGLIFNMDLLVGSHLENSIRDYTFFSYEAREALHLSKREGNVILDCLRKIAVEINQNIDNHSKTLIVNNIELLLNYCMRFYDRQFITRTHVNRDILVRFAALLDDYFKTGKTQLLGLPTVAYCAEKLDLSTNYFGDLIKMETGSTALDLLQFAVIEEAKLRMFEGNASIRKIGHQLGFKYQQHFIHLFKQKTGVTPHEFRHQN